MPRCLIANIRGTTPRRSSPLSPATPQSRRGMPTPLGVDDNRRSARRPGSRADRRRSRRRTGCAIGFPSRRRHSDADRPAGSGVAMTQISAPRRRTRYRCPRSTASSSFQKERLASVALTRCVSLGGSDSARVSLVSSHCAIVAITGYKLTGVGPRGAAPVGGQVGKERHGLRAANERGTAAPVDAEPPGALR